MLYWLISEWQTRFQLLKQHSILLLVLPHCAVSGHALVFRVVTCVLSADCFLSLFASFEIEIILASRWLWEATLWLLCEVLVIAIIYSQFWNILGRHHLHPYSFSWRSNEYFLSQCSLSCAFQSFFSLIRFVNWIDFFFHIVFCSWSLASAFCVYLKTTFSCSLLCGSKVFTFMF